MKFLRELVAAASNHFKHPSAAELAAMELAQAQRQLLEAQSAMEYAKRMTEYNSDRVRRLTAYVGGAQ